MTRRLDRRAVLTAPLLLGGCASLGARLMRPSAALAAIPHGRYALDPDHASLLWEANAGTPLARLGRFNGLSGGFDWSTGAPADCPLRVSIDTGSIDSGFSPLDELLRGAAWLDSSNHPAAVLEAPGLQRLTGNQGHVPGLLRLRGETHPLLLSVTFEGGVRNLLTGRYTLGFAATAELSRTAFGMTALPGVVGDRIGLRVAAEFMQTAA